MSQKTKHNSSTTSKNLEIMSLKCIVMSENCATLHGTVLQPAHFSSEVHAQLVEEIAESNSLI